MAGGRPAIFGSICFYAPYILYTSYIPHKKALGVFLVQSSGLSGGHYL
jgi:hypothetical protein